MKPWHAGRIRYAIEFFGAIILVFCSSFFVSKSTLTSLILIECATIVYRGGYYFFFWNDDLKTKLKAFLPHVVPGLIAIIVLALLKKGLKDIDSKAFIDVIMSVLMFAMMLPFIKQKNAEIKAHDASNLVTAHRLYPKVKVLFKLFTLLFRILIVLGFVFAIITTLSNFSSREATSSSVATTLICVGCVFWAGRIALLLYCWRDTGKSMDMESEMGEENIGVDESQSVGESPSEVPNISNSKKEEPAGEREVLAIVKKIAERWSYREDISTWVNNARIRYSVTVEIPYDQFIKYTISGKISCKDEDVSSAFTHLSPKMDRAAYKIQEKTQQELEKLNLSQPYEIKVEIGPIERDK